MARQMTVRGIPDEVARRLAKLSEDREQSINTIVVDILKRAVDVDERRTYLERYATWSDGDLAEFKDALAAQRVVDEKIWR